MAAIEHYNTELAHSAPGYMTSTTFAVGFKATSLSLHLPELRKPDCCGQHYAAFPLRARPRSEHSRYDDIYSLPFASNLNDGAADRL